MKIGIVTLSFNQAEFLQEAIDSATRSEQLGLDYVLVDPGSADGSREIVARNRDRFSRVLLDPDDGPSDGLNKGFARSDADVFGCLNADDRYPPGTLDYVARYFEARPDKDVLFGAIAIVDRNGKPSVRSRVPDRFDLRKYAERACNVWCPSTFYRREAFQACGGFNVANRTCWDGELAVDLALTGARLGYTDRVLGDFRVYAASLTGSGRVWAQYQADRERIRRKIYAALGRPYSPLVARVLRVGYKLDPVRQASYFGCHA